MTPPGTKSPAEQGAAAKAQPNTAPGSGVQPCAACTVTLAPRSVNICRRGGTVRVTATGNPAGGNVSAWTIADTSVATVAGAGNRATVTAVKAGRTTLEVTYQGGGCTCTDTIPVQICTLTQGRKYANALKVVANVIGVRAHIKTRYGKLTCEDEGCTNDSAYQCVYANVSGAGPGGGLIWAQSGYGRERNAGASAGYSTNRYAEKQGATYSVNFDIANAPAEGSVHQYQVVLDNTTGQWTYSQDGAPWQTYSDAQWRRNTGNSIQYTGEIFNAEDDMHGTAADKCEITECQYLLTSTDTEERPPYVLSNFGFDQSAITPEHQAILDAIADRVVASQSTPPRVFSIRLVGHTDAVGSDGYNIGLGQRRALAAATALRRTIDARQAGLSASIPRTTQSRGEQEPVDRSGTPAGDALNRRVEIFLSLRDLNWVDAGLVAADVSSDDPAEWGAEWVSGTALNIWDVNPL